MTAIPFVSGITAAGTNQGTALVLNPLIAFNQLSTVASGTGVMLPLVPTGSQVSICNNGANVCLVYPQVGGAIGSLASNAGFSLGVNFSATFTSVNGLNWCTGPTPATNTGSSVVSVTATTTLTSANFGNRIVLTSAVAPVTITLPAPSIGQTLIFEVNGALASAVTIAAGSAIIRGNCVANNATAVTAFSGTAVSNAIFGTTSVRGDRLVFDSPDGVVWNVVGNISVNTSMTSS